MCGINGIISKNGNKKENLKIIKAMNNRNNFYNFSHFIFLKKSFILVCFIANK